MAGGGAAPYSVLAADLDGDGDFDLAVENLTGHTVSILKNNGDGTFAAKVDYATGIASSVFAADLDGDGYRDLTVPNFQASTVSILKNNGDGTFAAKVDYGAGLTPYSVFAADLDGDGDFDLAVTNQNANRVSRLKNLSPSCGVPIITCPANISVQNQPAQCSAVVNFTASVSNCPGAAISCTPPSGSIFSVGTDTVTCIATTYASGNKDTCTFTVTVTSSDLEPPTVNCPGDTTVRVCPAATDSILTFTTNAADNCSGVSVNCTPPSGSAFPVGVTTVTCIATDASGNQDTCSFSLTVTNLFRGDMNKDGQPTSADVVLMLNCAFLGTGDCGICFSDMNCDGFLTSADVVIELNYVFLGILPPC